MLRGFFLHFFLLCCLGLQGGCGGGSSGTAIGPGSVKTKFSGIVVQGDGTGIGSAQITLLNTDDATQTDDSGAFELDVEFAGGDAAIAVMLPERNSSVVVVEDLPIQAKDVEVSILYDTLIDRAELLRLTLRARIVRDCSPLFLNTRTVRQTGAVIDGVICTIEVEIKSDGEPVNDLVFELQRRSCAADAAWQFVAAGVTGTSGSGFGEVQFPFRNDESHCVYRVIGPINEPSAVPVSTQINTLRKQEFDRR